MVTDSNNDPSGSSRPSRTSSGAKRTIVISLLVVFASAWVVIYIIIGSPRRKFDRFLTQVTSIQIGATKMDNWNRQLVGVNLSNVNSTCNQGTCAIWLQEQNTVLYSLHLAPLTVARATVTFTDGLASEIYIALVTEGRNELGEQYDDKGVVVRQTTDIPSNCHQHYELLTKQGYRAGDDSLATIAMDACVLPEDRAKAFALNTGCLTRISGCKTTEAIHPQMFARR